MKQKLLFGVNKTANKFVRFPEYATNQKIIDLTKQPQDIKDKIFDTINQTTNVQKEVANVGIHLLKFCSKHDLIRIRDNVKFYAEPFNARFNKDEAVVA